MCFTLFIVNKIEDLSLSDRDIFQYIQYGSISFHRIFWFFPEKIGKNLKCQTIFSFYQKLFFCFNKNYLFRFIFCESNFRTIILCFNEILFFDYEFFFTRNILTCTLFILYTEERSDRLRFPYVCYLYFTCSAYQLFHETFFKQYYQ